MRIHWGDKRAVADSHERWMQGATIEQSVRLYNQAAALSMIWNRFLSCKAKRTIESVWKLWCKEPRSTCRQSRSTVARCKKSSDNCPDVQRGYGDTSRAHGHSKLRSRAQLVLSTYHRVEAIPREQKTKSAQRRLFIALASRSDGCCPFSHAAADSVPLCRSQAAGLCA